MRRIILACALAGVLSVPASSILWEGEWRLP
jgi:hypothetical protein